MPSGLLKQGVLAEKETDNTLRLDGTPKSSGFLGRLFTRDGKAQDVTELSTSFDFDGKVLFAPRIVPTLSDEQVEDILSGRKLSAEKQRTLDEKAIEHAFARMREGKDTFFNEGVDNRRDFPERERFKVQTPRKLKGSGDIRL